MFKRNGNNQSKLMSIADLLEIKKLIKAKIKELTLGIKSDAYVAALLLLRESLSPAAEQVAGYQFLTSASKFSCSKMKCEGDKVGRRCFYLSSQDGASNDEGSCKF